MENVRIKILGRAYMYSSPHWDSFQLLGPSQPLAIEL